MKTQFFSIFKNVSESLKIDSYTIIYVEVNTYI